MALIADISELDANSYVTVEEADTYFATRAHAKQWSEFTVEEKEALLITSTSQLEWYVLWKGTSVNSLRALHFPATGIVINNRVIPDDSIPQPVKVAVMELALSNFNSDRTEIDGLDGIQMMKLDVLQIRTSQGGTRTKKEVIPDKIWSILAGFFNRGSIGVTRLIRC